MKKALLGAAILLAALSVVAAAVPNISVDSPQYDAGTVLSGSSIQHTFVLRNTGTSALQISPDIRVSCGCTTTRLSKTTLAPGESVDLAAIVATSGIGSYNKRIYVSSNDPDTPELTLYIRYTTVAALTYNLTPEELSLGYYYLVDIRDPSEYDLFHFLGAVNIPADSLSAESVELPKDTLLVIYDEAGDTSDALAQQLNGAGYTARSLRGGLARWVVKHGSLGLYLGAGITASDLPVGPVYLDGVRQAYQIDEWQLFPMYLLVDVRDAEPYAEQHLFGSINVPSSELTAWSANLPDSSVAGMEIYLVLYDDTGSASDAAASTLVDRGYDLARSLFGGLAEWMVQYGTRWVVNAE